MNSELALEALLIEGWAVTSVSGANEAGVATKAASAGHCHHVTGFSAVVSDAAQAAAAKKVQLKDGTTVIWEEILPATSAVGTVIYRTFPTPIAITTGAAVSLNSEALGSGSKCRLNLNGYTL